MSGPQVRITDPRQVPPSTGATVKAYVELTKPRIIELLLITTIPAMVVAEQGWPDPWLMVATLLGGTLSAGGANAINNYLDRDIDAADAVAVLRELGDTDGPLSCDTELDAAFDGTPCCDANLDRRVEDDRLHRGQHRTADARQRIIVHRQRGDQRQAGTARAAGAGRSNSSLGT